MSYRILVASYTNAVYSLLFDPSKSSSSALSLSSTLVVGHHPSWITRHPSDPTVAFTGLEQSSGRLLALKYDLESGKGKVVADIPSGGRDPCTILALKNELLVGNYSSGTVGVFSLPANTKSSEIAETQPVLVFSGTGPCEERQESSHPHQVYLVTHGSKTESSPPTEVLVPDLGADTTWRLVKNTEGKWEKKSQITYDQHRGGGPRHVVVHDSVLYTLLELTNQITAHTFTSLPSTSKASTTSSPPTLLASIPTLSSPPTCPPLTMLSAELLLPPPSTSFPTPYLYASTRNVPGPKGDIISIFSTVTSASSPSPATKLAPVNEIHTGLAHLRAFVFFGPDDRFLVAGGANGGGVKVFERVEGGKGLKEVAHLTMDNSGIGLCPTGFLCL